MNGIIHESFAVTQKYAWCSKIFLRFSSTSLTTQCRKHEQNKLFPTLFVFILIIIIFRYLIIIFNFFKSQWEDIVAQHLKVEFKREIFFDAFGVLSQSLLHECQTVSLKAVFKAKILWAHSLQCDKQSCLLWKLKFVLELFYSWHFNCLVDHWKIQNFIKVTL